MRFPLVLSLRPSRSLVALLGVLHGLAVLATASADIPALFRWALMAALFANLLRVLGRYARLTDRASIVTMIADKDGTLQCSTKAGFEANAEVLPFTAVLSYAIFVRIRFDGERRSRSIALLQDSLPPDQFRALRLWLRWKREPSAA